MKKSSLYILALVVLVLLGGFYLLTNRPKADLAPVDTSTTVISVLRNRVAMFRDKTSGVSLKDNSTDEGYVELKPNETKTFNWGLPPSTSYADYLIIDTDPTSENLATTYSIEAESIGGVNNSNYAIASSTVHFDCDETKDNANTYANIIGNVEKVGADIYSQGVRTLKSGETANFYPGKVMIQNLLYFNPFNAKGCAYELDNIKSIKITNLSSTKNLAVMHSGGWFRYNLNDLF